MARRARIDEHRCTGCMLCVQVCPINFERGPGGKALAVDGPLCVACGHCVAACAPGALEHSLVPSAGLERSRPGDRLAYESLFAFLRLRRSRREFKPDPVPREALDKLLAAAVQAPNSFNRQDVRYTVITDRALLKRISKTITEGTARLVRLLGNPAGRLFFRLFRPADYKALQAFMPLLELVARRSESGLDAVLYGAPCLILVSTPRDAACGAEDAVYCAANIQLAAEALGLGTCVVGFVTEPCRSDARLRALCRVPEGREVRTSLIVGWPRFQYAFSAPKLPPKADFV